LDNSVAVSEARAVARLPVAVKVFAPWAAVAMDCSVGSTSPNCVGIDGSQGGYTYGDFPTIGGSPEVHASGEVWAQTLWDLGQGTVEDVINQHSPATRPNYKTTQTILRIMEQKGLVRHESRGRVFVFQPCVTREKIGRLSVQNLLHQNFGGSTTELMVNLLETTRVDEKELKELESLIRNYRKQKNGDSKTGS